MTKTVTTQSNSALVIGAGIAGIRAALDLAERGHMVYLSDLGPYAGGALVRLDRWFPDNHCGMCRVLPSFNRDQTSQHCLRRGFTHPRISFVACSELKSVDGSAGDFQVTLTLAPRRIDPDLCIGCGKCAQACPVEVPDQFNQGRSLRRAAYLPNPMSEIKLYHIDEKACTACGACLDVCPVGAVDLAATAQERLLDVGALIVTTGFEPYEAARASQYGYGRFPNVITGFDLERLMSGSGPTEGELQRPSDDKIPKSVAFIQCVGSRSLEQHYCSSACCMYALKEAIMIKECYPDVDVHIFFMDMRAFGKGYYRYYENARDTHGISMSRCRIPRVRQNFSTANLLIHAVESDGRTAVKNFDLVVLSTGQSPSVNFQNIADCADIELNDDGFCRIRELAPVAASRDGVFVCGSTTGPCDIADTLADASAAAWLAAQLLECVESPALKTASAPAQDTAGCAVYLCNCGKELDLMLNFDELAVGVNQLKGVSHVEVVSNLCQAAECERVCARTAENRFAGVVLAGCSQLSAEPFAMMPACEIVNIRERLAWVHCDVTEAAGKKAVVLVGMAVQKLLNGSLPVRVQPITVVPHVTVLGGGLAGMTAARSLSRCGIDVVLVEKSEVLGGAARGLDMLLGGEPVADFLDALVDDITKSPRVSLNTATTVTGISGTAGDFTVSLSIHGDNEQVLTGALIFATGATEYVPQEYLFGEHDGVMTQRDCERKLAQGQSGIKDISSVVMIQCVGSMTSERPFCSRYCCRQALKNALHLKQLNPAVEVTIFYRELMSYGFAEKFYTAAREKGVLFVRYEPDARPRVSTSGTQLIVSASDPASGGMLEIEPDFVVLSTGLEPEDNKSLADLAGIECDADGFLQEADPKFRPVELVKDGMYVCGTAHSPRTVGETISQALAAAGRAGALVTRSRLVPGNTVSLVNATWCSGCELCIAACPYAARSKDAEQGIAVVNHALCQACGACVSVCPNKASSMQGWSDRQVLAMLDAAL